MKTDSCYHRISLQNIMIRMRRKGRILESEYFPPPFPYLCIRYNLSASLCYQVVIFEHNLYRFSSILHFAQHGGKVSESKHYSWKNMQVFSSLQFLMQLNSSTRNYSCSTGGGGETQSCFTVVITDHFYSTFKEIKILLSGSQSFLVLIHSLLQFSSSLW